MYNVYILECRDGKYYVGSARNVPQRLTMHRNGKGAAFTAARLPVHLVYHEPFETRAQAVQRERQLKGWSHAKKAALVAGNRKRLNQLAASRMLSARTLKSAPTLRTARAAFQQ